MVFLNEPMTLTKVAEYYGDLEKEIDSFNFGNEKLIKCEYLEKFGIYETKPHPYLLLVSHDKGAELGEKFNLILSITSYFPNLNLDIEKKFAEKLNLELEDAPNSLYQIEYVLGLNIFPLFEEHGEAAMKFLKAHR